jgi:hypothetical protein
MMKGNKSNTGFPAAVERCPVRYNYQRAGIWEKKVIQNVWTEIGGEVKKKVKENCQGKVLHI